MYDLKTTKFGPTFADDNFVTFARSFRHRAGHLQRRRLHRECQAEQPFFINGGFSTGLDVDDDCDQIVDSPQKRLLP